MFLRNTAETPNDSVINPRKKSDSGKGAVLRMRKGKFWLFMFAAGWVIAVSVNGSVLVFGGLSIGGYLYMRKRSATYESVG